MKRLPWRLMVAALGVFYLSTQLPAQRSFTTTYDSTRKVTLEGPVTKLDWVNPRAFLFINVRDSSGTVSNWAVEFGNPLELEKSGWKATSLKIGEIVRVEGVLARGEDRQASATSVVLKASGRRLFVPQPTRGAVAATPAPRWPNGHVRLGPPAGSKGYWGAASAKVLVENLATKPAMNDDGLLANLADIDKVAPLQPWARAVYEFRQRTLLKDDPLGRCLPPGGPRQFQMPYGFQFIEQPELGRILVLHGGGNRNWRIIHTDGRPVGAASEAVASYYGTSVGKWEGDTLVVDSVGFNEKFWMTAGGLPHTEALHLVERFSRPNLNTLRYEVTIDDLRAYTRRWNAGWTVQWVPNEELQEFFCEENADPAFNR
ncbi:MAG TPA: DUF6152 family protein [Terriglobia bacterium]|nr:DUF6152 family protein [Terriglobia bacterium]